MTRTAYDSIDPFAIPADAQVVLGIVDGIYAWVQPGAWSRFPTTAMAGISCVGTNAGTIGDVEDG